ncbi:hypothetical protein DXG01_015600 [Tephrocybe rancida]|nr:hypothetical protein DXG01_015600 [Tephrocybe rancida]
MAMQQCSTAKRCKVVPAGFNALDERILVVLRAIRGLDPRRSSNVHKEVFDAHHEHRMATVESNFHASSEGHNTWVSYDAVPEYLKKRFFVRYVEQPRCLNTCRESILSVLPFASLPETVCQDDGLQGSPPHVSLEYDRMQEPASYRDIEGHFEATAILGHICHTVPVHVVWGTANDFILQTIQEPLCDDSQGRTVASMTKVEGAGHMIVQEQPDRLVVFWVPFERLTVRIRASEMLYLFRVL